MKRESCIASRRLFTAAMGLTLVWLVTPAAAQSGQVRTFAMPACPIPETTFPPTKTQITLPNENPLGETFSIGGTVQVTDQASATIFLTQYTAIADSTGIDYSRTVKAIAHATGQLTFDKGCTKTDPYGSNDCHWDWGQDVTQARQGALQEDITAGKFIVDLGVDSSPHSNIQFSCPVCGATCTITVPERFHAPPWAQMWNLMNSQIFQFPLFLTNTPLPNF